MTKSLADAHDASDTGAINGLLPGNDPKWNVVFTVWIIWETEDAYVVLKIGDTLHHKLGLNDCEPSTLFLSPVDKSRAFESFMTRRLSILTQLLHTKKIAHLFNPLGDTCDLLYSFKRKY